MTQKLDVMLLGADNSARSIMPESIRRKLGAGNFHAFSAGSRPPGVVDAIALEVLASAINGQPSLQEL